MAVGTKLLTSAVFFLFKLHFLLFKHHFFSLFYYFFEFANDLQLTYWQTINICIANKALTIYL